MAKKPNPAVVKPAAPVHPAPSNRLLPLLLLAGIMLLTGILYLPSLRNGFTNWDDDAYVTANPDLAWNAKDLHTLATKEVAGNFHPLTMWSLAWDRGAASNKTPDPAPFHRDNLLLHLLNTALVFGLALRLRTGLPAAAIAALFFAIHPMHVESVAWVSGRKDVLYTAFFLGALITYTYLWEPAKSSTRLMLWGSVFVLFLLACLAKPAAIVFPLVLGLIHWYQDRHTAFQPQKLLYLLPFLAVSLVFSLVTFQYQKHTGAVDEQYGLFQKILFAAYGTVTYLWKMIVPVDLSAYHPAPVGNAPLGWPYYAAFTGALGILVLTAWSYFKKRDLFFALAWFFLNVLLVLGFIRVGTALYAERYTYLAYTGLFMVSAMAAVQLWNRSAAMKGLVGAVGIGLVVFWGYQTHRQIAVWHDTESLWTQIINQYPTEKCLSYRGYARYLDSKWDKALEDFNKAYALNPDNQTTVHIRAICLDKAGRKEESLQAYQEYDRKFPPNADVLFQMGNLLINMKRTPEAIACYEKSAAINPQNIDCWNNLANGYFNEKDYPKAEEGFSKALSINPNAVPCLNNRGAVRLTTAKWEDAIADFSKSLSLDANQPGIYRYRSMAYERVGKKEAAAADLAEEAKRKK
jgi:tetratricopeptide (TPR) repeat protein